VRGEGEDPFEATCLAGAAYLADEEASGFAQIDVQNLSL
jgi:hypothetical protein